MHAALGIDQYLPSNSYSSLVQQPTMWCKRFVPHLAGLARVDAEALDLGARRRATGAELDAAVADQIEHGDALGGAHRMVVRLGQQAHAVADADVLRDRGDVAVEHLGVRAVRVLVEEVVLDRPEASGSPAGRRASPARSCPGRLELGVAVPRAAPPGSRRTSRTSQAHLAARRTALTGVNANPWTHAGAPA